MAHILVPGCVQVNYFGRGTTGQQLLHVFHLRAPGPAVTAGDVIDACNVVAAWANNPISGHKEVLSDVLRIVRVRAVAADVVDGPAHELQINTDGVIALDLPAPSQVTLALKKASTRAGRRYRGRFFSWPIPASHVNELDEVADVYISELLACYELLRHSLAGAGLPMVVRSLAGVTMTNVQAIVAVDNGIDSMNTRTSNHGR